MQAAPFPANESTRLAALQNLDVLDSAPEAEFDALVKVASLVCGVPISLISLIDSDRQWFKASVGLPGVSETPRNLAFCAHAILQDQLFEVPDTAHDPRFSDNPLVVDAPAIRFYAGQPVVLQDGSRIGTLCVIDEKPRQLTEQQREIMQALAVATARALEGRRAMRALKRSEERMRMATEVGGIGIWDMDIRAGTANWDAQTYRLLGLDPADPTPRKALWRRHVHPDDQAAVNEAFQQSITTGQHYACALRVVWPDQSVRHLMGFGRVTLDEQGQPVSIIGIHSDVTQDRHYAKSLKDARDKAEQASQSKGQFLANMSHEIRTPMNAILGMLSLLHNTPLSPQQSDYVTKADGAARSLLGLLNDILDFSKVDAGKMTLEREPFRLEPLLRELSVVLSANVGAKPLEVLFDVDPSLPEVVAGDAMRLKQVLINLGGNAVKFTAHGQVVIALRCAGLTDETVAIEFEVKDTGIGIAPENLANLFHDFSQAEASTTRRFGGTGLGLAICKRLVKLMGGEIRIASTQGQGSSFAFTAVLERVHTVPAALQSPPGPPVAPQRVLVVDDNPVAGEVMHRMVQSLGWTADLAGSGAQALAMIAAQVRPGQPAFPYQSVYVDWQMPGMDGWETIRRLRQISQSCPGPEPLITMVTAHGRETLAQRSQAEQDMLNGFLVKPITAAMLRESVALTAGQPRLARAEGQRSSQRRLSGLRVLVVEDNLINQQVAEELLMSEGAMVFMAANGQLGVEAVAAAVPQFDVVLMDLQMPVLDGFGATRVIRDQLGLTRLPIVAMTANAMASDREACLGAGMNEHVGKPFDLAKLVTLLLRLTRLEPATAEPVTAASVSPDSPAWPVVPGLDVATALARMSGLQSLYVRTARDFSRGLLTTATELRGLLAQGDNEAALRLLHTLKGNAGTLGAELLAREAAQLEALCRTPAGRATCQARTETLARHCEATRQALAQVIEAWAPATPSPPTAPAAPLDRRAAREALVAMVALLVASDLSVLALHAQSRAALSGLPAGFDAALSAALDNLDFEAAHAQCADMLAQLNAA